MEESVIAMAALAISASTALLGLFGFLRAASRDDVQELRERLRVCEAAREAWRVERMDLFERLAQQSARIDQLERGH